MHFRSKTLSTLLVGTASVIMLSGCKTFGANLNFANQNLPKTQEDAARIHVSAYTPIPWHQISDRLDPNFTVSSAQDLLGAVLPITSSELNVSQHSQNFGFSANFADPTSSLVNEIVTTRNTDADGNVTATENETTTRNENSPSNTVTGLSSTLPGQIASQADPTPPTATTLGVDPFLQYRNATALFQEIQLLNSYLDAEIGDSDMVPYLIRMQISVQPYTRALPYDIYTEIYAQRKGAKIVPLVITDNNERSAERRLASAARQLQLAVSAQVQGTGLGGNAGNLEQELRDLQAFDTNATMLVGQFNDKQLNIRFGATKTPKGEYAVTARNYDISFVLLVPAELSAEEAEKDIEINKFNIFHYSTMRHAETGELLDRFNSDKSRHSEIEEILNIAEKLGLKKECRKLFKHNLTKNTEDESLLLLNKQCVHPDKQNTVKSDLIGQGKINAFFSRFKLNGTSGDKNYPKIETAYGQHLFKLLRRFLLPIEDNKVEITLPNQDYRIPINRKTDDKCKSAVSTNNIRCEKQPAILSDNGASDTIVALSGFKGLTTRQNISARLRVLTNEEIFLDSKSVSVDPQGNIAFAFPSVSGLGGSAEKCGKPSDSKCELFVYIGYEPVDNNSSPSKRNSLLPTSETTTKPKLNGQFGVAWNRRSAPTVNRLFNMTILPTTTSIVQDGSESTGTFRLNLTPQSCNPGANCPTVADHLVTTTNYPIHKVYQVGDPRTEISVLTAQNGFLATPGQSYDVTLKSLVNDATVAVTVTGRNAQQGPIASQTSDAQTVTFKADASDKKDGK